MELWRDAVHVLDARDRRHSGGAGRPAAGHESARRADDRIGHLHRHPDDDPDPGADHRMARPQAGAFGSESPVVAVGDDGTDEAITRSARQNALEVGTRLAHYDDKIDGGKSA